MPFQEQIPDQISGVPRRAECEGGPEAASAWHDNQSRIQTPEPERATDGCLKVLRQLCKHSDNERMHRFLLLHSTASLFSPQSSSQRRLCLELNITAEQMEIEFL